MLNGLSLFSGIGGLDVALSAWVRPVVYCEIEPFCQGVILSRISSGDLPYAPIWNDVSSLGGRKFNNERIDIIYGGFPCQDISVAGLGKGLEGKRSGLFFEIMRLAKEIQPKFLFLENVPAITSRGGIRVVKEIAEMGYDCRWCVISAASVGALHRRERWFLLGYSKHSRWDESEERESSQTSIHSREEGKNQASEFERTSPSSVLASETICDTLRTRIRQNLQSAHEYEKENGKEYLFKSFGFCYSIDEWREAVSKIRRTSNGIPRRMDRIKALGNAVVPIQAREAFKILMGIA